MSSVGEVEMFWVFIGVLFGAIAECN